MKSQIFKLLLITFLTISYIKSNAQINDYARSIIDTLCSDYMAGRAYVENGDQKAATYIKNEFENTGLNEIDNSYYQTFKINVNTFPKPVEIKINDTILQAGADYLIDPSCPAVKGEFETLYFLPKHLENETELEDFLSRVKDKFIVLEINRFKGFENTTIVKSFIFTLDKKYKHKGIVVISNSKLSWHISSTVADITIITIGNKFENQNIQKIGVQIHNEYKKKYKTKNVIGFIEGTEYPDSFIVFTAHYDHLGKLNDAIFRGANDNASGVAMLLNLAKYFKNHPPKMSVVFIAFSAEELGLLGSQFYANNPLHPLNNTSFLINIDLAGTGDEGIQIVNGSVYKKQFDKFVSLNDSLKLLPQIKIRGESCNSDHCPFYRKEVPCFFIYTLGGIKAYHDIYDVPETLPLTKFEEYYTLLRSFVENYY